MTGGSVDGQSGSSTPSRRLAAIMFTDLVGYSALAHRDEGLAIELLELHRGWVREILPRHGGIEIETVGDAFLIEFAGALAAVECAVAIQQRFAEHNQSAPAERRMQLRIGIHLGDVEHKDGKVMGDGVNIASRIHGMALPGGICVSEQVHHAVRNRAGLQFQSLGTPALKNIATRLELFRLEVGDLALRPAWLRRLPDAAAARKGLAVMLAVAALGGAVWLALSSRPLAKAHLESGPIAVLPCDNLSGQPGLDLLAEGIAEEVSSRLARIKELAIIGRTSTRAIKKALTDVLAIGEKLGARAVLTCSVRTSPAGVRLSAQLVAIPSGVEAWSATLDHAQGNTNDPVDEIALAVADAVLPELVGSVRARLIRHNTNNSEALEAYLHGVSQSDAFTLESLQTAARNFETAVKLDPGFVLAYVKLADARTNLVVYEPARREELAGQSLALANKAVELDPGLPEAWAELASIKHNLFLDWSGAGADLDRALKLGPNSAFVNKKASDYMRGIGLHERALFYAENGVRLDPVNQLQAYELITALYDARRFDRCISEARQAVSSHPDVWFFRVGLGLCESIRGQREQGLSDFQAGSDMIKPPPPFLRCPRAMLLGMSGRHDEAQREIEAIRAYIKEHGRYFVPIYSAFAGLGDKDATLAAFEAAFDDRDWLAYGFLGRMQFDFLRDDPRFIALTRKYGRAPDGTLLETGR